MKQRTKLIVFGSFMAVWGAFAVPIAWHWFLGFGCVRMHAEWSPAGRRVAEEWVGYIDYREGDCFYWGDDGRIDPDRSGRFEYDERVRPLQRDEIERCDASWIVAGDLYLIQHAEELQHARRGRCAPDPEIFHEPVWSEVTGKSNPRPLDPWGRPYEIVVTRGGAGVIVSCRGRDGLEGGTGEDVDQRSEWDASMEQQGRTR
jgi:hypothetical protein